MNISRLILQTFKTAATCLTSIMEGVSKERKDAVKEVKAPDEGNAEEPKEPDIPVNELDAKSAGKTPGAWLSISQYNQKHGMSKTTVRNWARNGKLKSYKDERGRIFVLDKDDEIPVLDQKSRTWHLIPIESFCRKRYGSKDDVLVKIDADDPRTPC